MIDVIVADLASETLKKLHVEKAILSADAVDVDHGMTNTFEVGIR